MAFLPSQSINTTFTLYTELPNMNEYIGRILLKLESDKIMFALKTGRRRSTGSVFLLHRVRYIRGSRSTPEKDAMSRLIMRRLSDELIHSDVSELNVNNNLSGMKRLEGNYDCCLQSQRSICYLTSFPGRYSNTTMYEVLVERNKKPYHECGGKTSSKADGIT